MEWWTPGAAECPNETVGGRVGAVTKMGRRGRFKMLGHQCVIIGGG